MKTRNVDMDDELWDALKAMARRKGVAGAASLVRMYCLDGLSRDQRLWTNDPRAGGKTDTAA